MSHVVHGYSATPAAIAGVMRFPEQRVQPCEVVVEIVEADGVGQVLDLLGEPVCESGEAAHPIRMVRCWRSTYEVDILAGSGSPIIGRASFPVTRAGE